MLQGSDIFTMDVWKILELCHVKLSKDCNCGFVVACSVNIPSEQQQFPHKAGLFDKVSVIFV